MNFSSGSETVFAILAETLLIRQGSKRRHAYIGELAERPHFEGLGNERRHSSEAKRHASVERSHQPKRFEKVRTEFGGATVTKGVRQRD